MSSDTKVLTFGMTIPSTTRIRVLAMPVLSFPPTTSGEWAGTSNTSKKSYFSWEIERSEIPSDQWEKKGSALLTTTNIDQYGDQIMPAIQRIYRKLGRLGGQLFFYGQQKPIGPVSETKEASQDRENHCLIQAINRLGTLASNREERLLVIMDGQVPCSGVAVCAFGSV